MNSSQQIVLAQRPHGHVSVEDFRVEDVALPELEAGDVALETLFISIDPAIRGWLDDRPSYLPPVALGEPVRAFGLARVRASRNSNFTAGDIVRASSAGNGARSSARPVPTGTGSHHARTFPWSTTLASSG